MGRRSPYPEEFKKDAVALRRAAGGKRTCAAVAADLGITAESLRTWARNDESQAAPEHRSADGSADEEPARLRAENARLSTKSNLSARSFVCLSTLCRSKRHRRRRQR
ncbi:transposase [Streptomyces sp. JNUCC 63]